MLRMVRTSFWGAHFLGYPMPPLLGKAVSEPQSSTSRCFWANSLLWKARFRPRLKGFQAATCLKQVVG